jgi:hypothetical protein
MHEDIDVFQLSESIECGFRRIADRIPTQAGQRSDDCGQPMMTE